MSIIIKADNSVVTEEGGHCLVTTDPKTGDYKDVLFPSETHKVLITQEMLDGLNEWGSLLDFPGVFTTKGFSVINGKTITSNRLWVPVYKLVDYFEKVLLKFDSRDYIETLEALAK